MIRKSCNNYVQKQRMKMMMIKNLIIAQVIISCTQIYENLSSQYWALTQKSLFVVALKRAR